MTGDRDRSREELLAEIERLRGELAAHERELASQRETTGATRAGDDEEVLPESDLAILARTAMLLVEFPQDGDLYRFVAEEVRRIVGGRCIVAVTDYDETSTDFQARHFAGLDGTLLEGTMDLLGIDPLNIRAVPPDEVKNALVSPTLSRIEAPIHVIADGKIPPAVADGIVQLLGIENIHGMGFVRSGRIFGNVTIVSRGSTPPIRASVVEAFVRQVTVALEKRHAEEESSRLESELLHAQKMDAIGRLAGGIAHDFGNQLYGIIGFASLLRMRSEEGSQIHEAACIIEESGKRAHELTRHLLDFARRSRRKNVPVDVHQVVEDVRKLLDRTIDKRISLVSHLRCEPPFVTGDPSQVEQVVMNLCVNARDAMPSGGKLVVSTTKVDIDDTFVRLHPGITPGQFLKLTVEDTGIGMTADVRERIFEPFFTTKTAGEGTGMGLATVYGIVQAHGGSVTVVSHPGKGSVFSVYLPIAVTTEDWSSEEVLIDAVKGSGTVLVVDDETNVRRTLSSMLGLLGYDVVSVANGREAVSVFRKSRSSIDVVILDLTMPVMDGATCYRHLREIDPDVKVILATAHGPDDGPGALMEEGILEYIQKPFLVSDLSRALARALG